MTRRPVGVWVGVVGVLAVLALFSPLVFLSRSSPDASSREPLNAATTEDPAAESDVTPAEVGFEFTKPEHVRLRFAQDLALVCQGMDTVDNGGFDSFDMDIWIDHANGRTRLGIDYPDGSTYDLILDGQPGEWEQAWGRGSDLGRSAGCREALGDGASSQSIAGWAYQDASPLWFETYLKPVTAEVSGIVVLNHEGIATEATSIGPRSFMIETNTRDGTNVRFDYTLDEAGLRVMGDERHAHVPNEFDANATVEVLESGPAPMPTGIFDISSFTPLWGGDPVPTTEATTP